MSLLIIMYFFRILLLAFFSSSSCSRRLYMSFKESLKNLLASRLREMAFLIIYVSFNMILGAYLVGNMTPLIVKGSKTERFRDEMTNITRYMDRTNLSNEIRNQIKRHLRLQYECSRTKSGFIDGIPEAVKAKLSQSLYFEIIQKVPLFKGCSDNFLNQIVMKLTEEFFLPGEVILEQGTAVDHIYIISHGSLHIAVSRGHEDIVKFLIQRKAEVNFLDKFGNSPLLEAVKAGHDEIAKLLLENGAVLNLEDSGTYVCKLAADNKVDIL